MPVYSLQAISVMLMQHYELENCLKTHLNWMAMAECINIELNSDILFGSFFF